MKREKKSNNIFNKPILPESLFYEEVQKDYKVGGVKVQGCWLKDSPPQIYKSSVKSAIELADLKAQLDQTKKNSSSQNPTDLFRMAELRKNMENFELMATSPVKKRFKEEQLQIHAENLIMQKVDSFWGKIYERKCKIEDKQLIFQSEKEKNQKTIDIKDYTLQLEDRLKPSNQSKDFIWPEKYNVRLYMHGANLRSYCIYGQQKSLRNILKNIKIESIKLTQVDFFKNLSKQYEQKMMILFGNRLRVYEHLSKQKQKEDLNIAFDLIQKSHLLDDIEQEKKPSDKVGFVLDQSFQNSETSNRNITSKSSLNKSINFGSSPAHSPLLSPLKSPLTTESQFKMRARRSMINYDDLDNEDDGKQYQIEDFNLQIKEVAHSDSESEAEDPRYSLKSEQNPMYNILQNSMELKKKNFDNKRFAEQVIIPQFMNEESFSDSSSNYVQKKTKISPLNKIPIAQFEMKEAEYTHYVYLAFFEDFCAYSQHEVQLVFYQRVLTNLEYENMKIPVCTCQKIVFKRSKQEPRLYIPEKETIVKVSKKCDEIWILLQNKANQIKQKLQINLEEVLYAVDQSQLVYMKTGDRIVCAGKLKIIISPTMIIPAEFKEETTLKFLEKYLITEDYTREDKYKFIDYKKRNHQVCQRWNNKMMKRIIARTDENEFLKAIYYGFPKNILEKIGNTMKTMKSLTRSQTRIESSSSYFSTQSYSLMESQIMKMKAYDLRVFIKIDKLVDFIIQERKNQYLQKRLDEVCMFFSFKYGKSSVQKLMSVYVIQTLRKVENLLLQLKNSKQIEVFLSEYFEVEYEIDDLMTQVSAYFN